MYVTYAPPNQNIPQPWPAVYIDMVWSAMFCIVFEYVHIRNLAQRRYMDLIKTHATEVPCIKSDLARPIYSC